MSSMPRRSCTGFHVHLALLVAGLAGLPAAAAPTTHADPAGICAGASPCFTTLQQAVDNAGPAPATIRVFPGIYPESVDLTTMGSAIGQTLGDLTIQGVDTGGAPTMGQARIDPGAPGGPGSGRALGAFDLMVGEVDMNLTLRGLEATSPDSDGFLALVSGNIVASDLLATGCGGSGMTLAAAGNLTARNLTAVLNTDFGLNLGSETGVLDVADLVAEHNDGGMVLFGLSSLLAANLRATANGGGIGTVTCNGGELDGLVALSNTGPGMELQQAPSDMPPCGSSLGSLVSRDGFLQDPLSRNRRLTLPERLAAWQQGRHSGPPETGEAELGAPAPLHLTNSQALNNGEVGIGVFFNGSVVFSNLTSRGNGDLGMVLLATAADVSGSVFEQNGGGALIGAESLTLDASRATDNLGGGGGGLPGDGYGFLVGAGSAVLTNVEGSRNLEAGLAVGFLLTGPSSFFVDGGTFEDNRAGIETVAAAPEGPSVVLRQVTTRNNVEAGVLLPGVERASLIESQVEANGVGLRASPKESLRVTLSTFTGNQVGAGVDFQPGATGSIHCSNFTANASGVGLELLSDSPLDATTNFWGSPLGPTHPANPGGAGEMVLDSADGAFGTVAFEPFLEAPATAADCPVEAVDVVEVPMSPPALALLALLLAAVAMGRLRTRSRV
ncbi:MAG: hypothetical protein KDD11_17360 [Acidobacteria bacterium]|nr:hypothetical protein [Acidobacteriota bacterium]